VPSAAMAFLFLFRARLARTSLLQKNIEGSMLSDYVGNGKRGWLTSIMMEF
jgi:hypothetical protein